MVLLVLVIVGCNHDHDHHEDDNNQNENSENNNENPNENGNENNNENPNENGNENGNGDPNGNGNEDPNGNGNENPEPTGPFIRFPSEEVNIYLDVDYELEYETNYEGDITFSTNDDDMIWLDGETVTGLELGEAKITASFEVDGVTYSAELKLIINEVVYKISIEGVTYNAVKGTTYEDFLTETFGEKMYPEKEGYEFVEWYYDSNYKNICHSYSKVNSNVSLYPKYKKFIYGVKIDKVFGYHSGDIVNGQVVAISPSYDRNLNDLNLNFYDLVAVRYNPTLEDYFVVSVGEKKVYYDGFLLGFKQGSSEAKEFLPKLTVGTKVWLDNYSINKATKLELEHEIDPSISTINLDNISTSYASAYDVTNKVHLGDKAGDSRCYPASTTKIVTAMAALKYCPIDTTYKIGAELDLMWQGSSPGTAKLQKGQTWTLAELLYATLLPSGNDAAYSLGALTINYLYPNNTWTIREQLDKFAELMNEVAQEAGATRSHFMVPDGNSYYKSDGSWDDRLTYHYVTANDMVKITRYAFTFGEIAEVVSTVSKALTIDGTSYSYTNTNHLLNPTHGSYYNGTVGMKTGTTTPAGQCLITGVFKEGRFVIVAIMKAGSAGRDSASLAVYDLIFKSK